MQPSSGIHVAYWCTVTNARYLYWLSSNVQAMVTVMHPTNAGVASVTDIAQITVNSSIVSGQPLDGLYRISNGSDRDSERDDHEPSTATGIDIAVCLRRNPDGLYDFECWAPWCRGKCAVDLSNSSQILFEPLVSGGYCQWS